MIIFTQHALTKLRQRDITETTVIKTLKSPDHISAGYSGRKIAYKKFDNLFLKVVFRKENQSFVVITQYWTKEIK